MNERVRADKVGKPTSLQYLLKGSKQRGMHQYATALHLACVPLVSECITIALLNPASAHSTPINHQTAQTISLGAAATEDSPEGLEAELT
eukprot:jgi/Chrzof1/13059/Cz07g18110.t1